MEEWIRLGTTKSSHHHLGTSDLAKRDAVMRCQHVDDDTQCRMDARRRVLVASGDPPDPDQSGFAGTVYLVQVCKEHDPDPRAVDACATSSGLRADRPTPEAVALPGLSDKRRGPARRDARICAEERLVHSVTA
jgi:hypothetical protein